VFFCLSKAYKRLGYTEVISRIGDNIVVESGYDKPVASSELPSHWTRVQFDDPPSAFEVGRLRLKCSGQSLEIGQSLSKEEKRPLMRSALSFLSRASVVAILSLISLAARASDINMPIGVTPISKEVYGLHMLIFYICCVIGVAVFGVMFYSIFKHRKSKGAVAADFHESTVVEIAWTTVPLRLSMEMALRVS